MITPTARSRSVERPQPLGDVGAMVGASPPDPPGSFFRRPVTVAIGLLLFYVALSFTASPDGYLSTDVGGKTAALAAMTERGDWATDMGYWAEDSDPDGVVYPYAHTLRTDNGWWVNTTSITMVLLARPLWQIGGAHLILLLPMLSAVGAAVVAGRMQSRLDGSDGIVAMLAVGIASPVMVYALDFWEHTPGVFLMALGCLAVMKAVEGLGAHHGAAAGACFAIAASMRQEALVYGFVAGLVMTVALARSELFAARRPIATRLRALLPSALMASSAVAFLGLTIVIEEAYYGEALRSNRGAQAASAAAGLDGASERVTAALTTALSPVNGGNPGAYLMGGLLLFGLLWLGFEAERGHDTRVPMLAVALIGLPLAFRFVQFGPDFVSGMVPTTTLAAAGALFGVRRSQLRLVAAIALGSLPLVFATQYTAGAGPQWGGRYLLLSGYLLTICGCVGLARHHRALLSGLIAAGVAVSLGGVWFVSARTHDVASDMDRIEAFADGDVVVWFDPVIAREGGPAIVDQRWLTSWADARSDALLGVLADESIDEFVYIDHPARPVPAFDGFVVADEAGTQMLEFFERRVTRFRSLSIEASR